MAQRKVLHSWKDISNYTGRGVRTIQRYEVKLGFPVHRPAGKNRSAVLAFSDEVDAWFARAPKREKVPDNRQNGLSAEQTRTYLAIAAQAKRSRETAQKAFESCQHQAKRVEVLVQKLEKYRTRARQQAA
jgi:hypothetical protein